MLRRVVSAGLLGCVLPLAGWTPTADATGTAQVIVVDRYTHGQIQISLNGVTKVARNGDRIGPFAVRPDSMGNDGIDVRLVKHPHCGIGQIGYYFKAGHRYRVRVNDQGGANCHFGGRLVRGPHATVEKIS